MKVYLVWYRLGGETEDRIRGAAKNWARAERMAENLEFMLRSSNKTNFTYGVKSYEHGSMSSNTEDDGCSGRWGPEKFGEN